MIGSAIHQTGDGCLGFGPLKDDSWHRGVAIFIPPWAVLPPFCGEAKAKSFYCKLSKDDKEAKPGQVKLKDATEDSRHIRVR
jgi:hypothetical protein